MHYYYYPTSHWSRIVSVVLAEKGLAPTPHLVDITKNATFDPEYLRMNPRGVVPTLVDGDKVVWNGPTIAKYVDEKAPGKIFPDEPEVREWSKRLEDFPVMLFSYSVWVLGKRGENSATILDDKVERARDYAKRHPELADQYDRKREFFEGFRARVYDDDFVAAQLAESRQLLDELGRRLGISVEKHVVGFVPRRDRRADGARQFGRRIARSTGSVSLRPARDRHARCRGQCAPTTRVRQA